MYLSKKLQSAIDEDQLLSGKPEPTNEWYAIAEMADQTLSGI